MTRQRTYVLTGIAAALYVMLCWIFADGMFHIKDAFFYQTNPQDGMKVYSDGTMWTYVLLALIVLCGIYQARQIPEEGVSIKSDSTATHGQVDDPVFWKLLIGNTFYALLWLPLRFYIGRDWLAAGEHKIRSDAWMDGGAALQGYWTRATTVPEGGTTARAAGTVGWFNDFLTYMLDHEWYTWFAKVIAIGEFMIGIGLLVGALVGIAAFFGSFMNINFMLAGTTSSNPVMFALTVFLVLGWKVAGFWGLDRYLLPILRTPWNRYEDAQVAQTPPVEPTTPYHA